MGGWSQSQWQPVPGVGPAGPHHSLPLFASPFRPVESFNSCALVLVLVSVRVPCPCSLAFHPPSSTASHLPSALHPPPSTLHTIQYFPWPPFQHISLHTIPQLQFSIRNQPPSPPCRLHLVFFAFNTPESASFRNFPSTSTPHCSNNNIIIINNKTHCLG